MDYSTLTDLQLESWDGSGKWFADEELGIKPSDGSFEIEVRLIGVPGGGDNTDRDRIRTTEAFQATVKYQVEHQQKIFSKIMDAAQQEYDNALANKDAYDPETVDLYLPPVNNQDDLKALITPLQIHIGYTDEEGVRYVGYEFDCSWDDEHGFGVRLQGLEIEAFGYADVCF